MNYNFNDILSDNIIDIEKDVKMYGVNIYEIDFDDFIEFDNSNDINYLMESDNLKNNDDLDNESSSNNSSLNDSSLDQDEYNKSSSNNSSLNDSSLDQDEYNKSLDDEIEKRITNKFTEQEIKIIKVMHLLIKDATIVLDMTYYTIKKILKNIKMNKWPSNYIHKYIEKMSLKKYESSDLFCKYLMKKYHNKKDIIFINMIFAYMSKYNKIDPKDL